MKNHYGHCLIALGLAAALLVAFGVSASTLLVVAVAAACPLMMFVMMRGMTRMHDHTSHHDPSDQPTWSDHP